MSLASLEKCITAEARVVLKNPKFKRKDILAWCTGEIAFGAGEILFRCPAIGVHVCCDAKHDKRKAK